jgi:hypothetical protein
MHKLFLKGYRTQTFIAAVLNCAEAPDEVAAVYSNNACVIEQHPELKAKFQAAELRVSGRCPTLSEGWEGGTPLQVSGTSVDLTIDGEGGAVYPMPDTHTGQGF